MVAKNALHNLKSGLVLDYGVFVSLSQHDLLSCIEDMRVHAKKPLVIVDSAKAFFTPQKLLALIQANDKEYLVVNEALGDFFSEQQIAALGGANLVLKGVNIGVQHEVQGEDVIVNLGGQKVNEDVNYSFQTVPPGWTVTGNMSLGPTKIKRKVENQDGDGTLFFVSPKDFEKLWLFASKAWSGADAPISTKINTGLGVKTALLHDDKIELGGNYIRRYEIEQVAKHRQWAMPANAKIAA